MAAAAVALCLLYTTLIFGVQAVIQRRRSGSSGWVRSFGSSRAERAANAMFILGCLLDLAGPLLVLVGVLRPIPGLNAPGLQAFGLGLFGVATAAALTAQHTMGDAWRTGVDTSDQTSLVTRGLFSRVRNPVYSTMVATSLATALLVPTVLSPLALVGCLLAVEVQTRHVEEPYLTRAHGDSYRRYAAGVGRFLPSLGRLRS